MQQSALIVIHFYITRIRQTKKTLVEPITLLHMKLPWLGSRNFSSGFRATTHVACLAYHTLRILEYTFPSPASPGNHRHPSVRARTDRATPVPSLPRNWTLADRRAPMSVANINTAYAFLHLPAEGVAETDIIAYILLCEPT